jgi:predicted peroxiredoxin
MKTLYFCITGSGDPTRASIPLHLAANGSVEAGHEVGILLAGDGTELLDEETVARVEGTGVPPMRDLLAKLVEHQVPIYV